MSKQEYPMYMWTCDKCVDIEHEAVTPMDWTTITLDRGREIHFCKDCSATLLETFNNFVKLWEGKDV